MGTLITTTTKSIDFDPPIKRANTLNKSSIRSNEPRPTIDEQEECDYGDDDSHKSTGSLSDTDHFDETNLTHSANTTRPASRTNSGAEKKPRPGSNLTVLPTSDSQYYASMSSAPTGFSISYHKRMTNFNDDLRKQAAFSRVQQQNKKGAGEGTSQLMVCRTLYIHFHNICF